MKDKTHIIELTTAQAIKLWNIVIKQKGNLYNVEREYQVNLHNDIMELEEIEQKLNVPED